MPRFTPDLDETRATTRVFDPCEAEMKITGVQGVLYMKEEDGDEWPVAGVRCQYEHVGRIQDDGSLDTEHEGEDMAPDTHYIHSEGALPFTKRFLMAAYGFTREEEEEFDDFLEERDFSLDGDPESDEDPEIGDGWKELEGLRVAADVDIRAVEDEETGEVTKYQDYTSYFPAD